jgi:hypothetical protein
MARVDLPEELKAAGRKLLETTDALLMQAQGAMWVYSHLLNEWRYYLVTSLVDSIGRRKTYRLLLDAFERVELPKEMTVEDVYLGSPSDEFFRLVSSIVRVETGATAAFRNCLFNETPFDGVVYRSVQEIPTEREAEQIEKRFQKRVKDLQTHGAKSKQREERADAC